MKTYQGGCHCGAVCFEVTSDLAKAIQCNCSICTKKGALHHRVAPARFRLLKGKQDLVLYRFGTNTAKHWFCRHCGIHVFSNPRLAPDACSVNIRCLDDFEALLPGIEIVHFDGRHWEQAASALQS